MGLCNTRNIVDLEWLSSSLKAKEALPVDEYLMVNDADAEARYGFSMHASLDKAAEMRKKRTRVLTGWYVHVCKGVAGSKAPPENELRLIVEGAGGTWVSSATQKALAGIDYRKLLIITSDPTKATQVSPKAIKEALAKKATSHTTTWLFDCIMKQEIVFEA